MVTTFNISKECFKYFYLIITLLHHIVISLFVALGNLFFAVVGLDTLA